MGGLIYKDIVTLRKELGVLFFMIFFYEVIIFMNWDENFAVMYLLIISISLAVLPATLCAYDDRKDWNTFICATPLSKQKIVGSKYALYFLSILGVLLFAAISFCCFTNGIPLNILLTLVSCAVILGMIQFPIHYQLGVERGRIISMAMVFLPMFLLIFLQRQGFISLDSISDDIFSRLPYYTVPLALIFTLLSYCLSLAIYRNKER